MFNVLPPTSEFNAPSLDVIHNDFARVGGRIGHSDGRGAHADELFVADDSAGDDARARAAELDAGLQEWDAERSFATADECHAEQGRKLFAETRAAVGITPIISVSRSVSVRSIHGHRYDWVVMVYGGEYSASGVADTPAEALASLLSELDARHGISSAFGGFRVRGVALVLAGIDRSKADALALARRIACDPAYLDVLLSFHVPGVVDERPAPVAVAA